MSRSECVYEVSLTSFSASTMGWNFSASSANTAPSTRARPRELASASTAYAHPPMAIA